jgi:penicillin-binding protein 1B
MAGLRNGRKPATGGDETGRAFLKIKIKLAILQFSRQKWVRVTAVALAIPAAALSVTTAYYYVSFARLIDARLHGARQRVLPKVFARPLELRRGQALTDRQLVDQLNDLGYAQRADAGKPGEFAMGDAVVSIRPRSTEWAGQLVRVTFRPPAPAPTARGAARRATPKLADHIVALETGSKTTESITLDAPLLTSLINGGREKRRPVALSAIQPRVVDAVLSIEDRRYYHHPGVDPIRLAGAIVDSVIGSRRVSATSTITQQLVRNVILPQFEGWTLQTARERTIRRKVLEQFLAIVLDTRASKDEILEMYLNDMPLGQRGSFSIVGFPEAARLFFGKDVSNVTLAEAATMAGVLQSPSALSPFNNPDKCRERRNVVLQSMADAGYIDPSAASLAAKEPLVVVQRALEAEAPNFVDYVARSLDDDYPGLTTTTDQAVDVYTTLDLHLQRLAQDAVRAGLTHVDELLARRRRKGRAEAALLALDPRTGEILAMVGGRSYNQSQYNRAVLSRRQPGSVFKPFVYLTAFEEAAHNGEVDVTPASLVDDVPTTWEFDGQVWSPENYEHEYAGLITFRQALAYSRNVATIKVAEGAGYGHIAALWKKLGVGNPPKAYPSIALGVFEATPFEIATAYTIFPNLGTVRPLRHILKIESGGKNLTKTSSSAINHIARPDTTFLVTNMMRSVIDEGTGAGVRAAGFTRDAAGKTGTTNDLRDAWFVGFTPTLLTVVWVGFDENQPLGLSGAQAALPIWTGFMIRALAGTPSMPFEAPDGISFVDIDADTGQLAVPACPHVIREAFLAGSEPTQACARHRF